MLSECFNVESWEHLTRLGVPTLVVRRRPLLWDGTMLAVGDVFPGTIAEARKMYRLHYIGVQTERKQEVKKNGLRKTPTASTRS